MKLKVWVGSQIEWVKTQSVCQKTLLFWSRLIFLYFGNGGGNKNWRLIC